jgi:Tol biopolymer transport system component
MIDLTSVRHSKCMSAILRSALLLSLLAVIATPVSAQYFGRNKVQYESFDFSILKTSHFDIHFYPEEYDAVIDAARMGERWYERLARTFQHEFEASKPVIFYADHPDFQQTNTLSGFISEGTGGVTESLKNRVIMPLGESYAATDHVLGHELVHAFQYNIAQSRAGGGLPGLFRLPLWSIEGMAEYLSVGREDALTAMWLRDAVRRDDFPTIQQMTRESRFFPYRFGQALWAYIGGTYGDDAVVQLFRSALRVGWEPSLNQVLGTTSDSLSARWRRSVESAYLPLIEGRTVPGEIGTMLLSPATGAGRQNVAPSLSPDGRYVAFISEKDLFSFDLFIADARTGEVVKKVSSASSDPHFDALRFIDSSGSWSPDGSRLAFVVFADGDNAMVIVDTDSGDVLDRLYVEEVGAITNPAWSPDGQFIAFSGTQGGMTDIYVYDLEVGVTRQLTYDRHGDFQPDWSPDGTKIVFSTDRGAETDFDRLTYSQPQLAIMDVASGNIELLELFGDVKHMNPQFAPDGESLYFISDVDGFSDVYRLTLATDEVHRITRIATGVSGITGMAPAMSVANEAGTMAFSVFDEFQFHIYTLDVTSGSPERVSRVASATESVGRLLPPAEPEFASRVARYLEDWSTGLQTAAAMSQIEEYSSGLALDYVGQPSFGVAADRFGTYIGGGAAAYFSDMLGDRILGVAVQANGTLKDIGGQVFYQNMKRRWNWGVSGGRTPLNFTRSAVRFNPNGTQDVILLRQRLFIDQVGGLLAYPFTQTRRFEINGGFTRYSYDYEQETFITDPFGQVLDRQKESLPSPDPLNLASTSVALVGDNSFFGFTSPIRGGRSRFEVGATVGTINYWTLTLDWRKYFNPARNLTFAIRGLHIGRYGSEIEQTNLIQPFFIGYETLIRGYANESFEARECQTTGLNSDNTVGVVGCPVWENLFGHRFGVANMELRLPVFGTEQFGLFNLPYLPTELVFFTDAGVAWDGTRCEGLESASCTPRFTFSSVVDGVTPQPVFASGISARMNILGFMIFEAYYAYPWQRPQKGWHWGFNIAPGW